MFVAEALLDHLHVRRAQQRLPRRPVLRKERHAQAVLHRRPIDKDGVREVVAGEPGGARENLGLVRVIEAFVRSQTSAPTDWQQSERQGQEGHAEERAAVASRRLLGGRGYFPVATTRPSSTQGVPPTVIVASVKKFQRT